MPTKRPPGTVNKPPPGDKHIEGVTWKPPGWYYPELWARLGGSQWNVPLDKQGFPNQLPAGVISQDVQFASDKYVAAYNADQRQAAQGTLQNALESIGSYRVGSAAQRGSGLVGQLAQTHMQSQIESPDLMHWGRRDAESRARNRARKAGYAKAAGAVIGGLLLPGVGAIAGAAIGSQVGGALGGEGAAGIGGQAGSEVGGFGPGAGVTAAAGGAVQGATQAALAQGGTGMPDAPSSLTGGGPSGQPQTGQAGYQPGTGQAGAQPAPQQPIPEAVGGAMGGFAGGAVGGFPGGGGMSGGGPSGGPAGGGAGGQAAPAGPPVGLEPPQTQAMMGTKPIPVDDYMVLGELYELDPMLDPDDWLDGAHFALQQMTMSIVQSMGA